MSSPIEDMVVPVPADMFATLLAENERLNRQVTELQRENTREVERRREAEDLLKALGARR